MKNKSGSIFRHLPRGSDSRCWYGDSPSYFPLSEQQAKDVIHAVDIPLVRHWHLSEDGVTPDRPVTLEEALDFHAFAVHQLIGRLEDLGLHPQNHKSPSPTYRRRALRAVVKLQALLDEPETRALHDYRDEDLRPLKEACAQFLWRLEISERLSVPLARKRQLLRKLGGSQLELFIRNELAGAFKEIFGRKASVARPTSKAGLASGPFIRFADAFFATVGLKVSAETVARAMWKRSN